MVADHDLNMLYHLANITHDLHNFDVFVGTSLYARLDFTGNVSIIKIGVFA